VVAYYFKSSLTPEIKSTMMAGGRMSHPQNAINSQINTITMTANPNTITNPRMKNPTIRIKTFVTNASKKVARLGPPFLSTFGLCHGAKSVRVSSRIEKK